MLIFIFRVTFSWDFYLPFPEHHHPYPKGICHLYLNYNWKYQDRG